MQNTSQVNTRLHLYQCGSAKWLGCAASLICEYDIPNTSGAAAVNGTCMHLLAETVLNRVIKGEDVRADTYKGVYALNEGKGPIKALVKPEKGAVLITDDFVSQVSKYAVYPADTNVFQVQFNSQFSYPLSVFIESLGLNCPASD